MKKNKYNTVSTHDFPAAGVHPRGLPGCSPPPQIPQNPSLKNTDFVDSMIPNVLHDLPFSRNQPLKSADD
jgi:hypothetical protein